MLDLVVSRALEKDPAQRYQNAQELADDLQSALSELPARAAAPAAAPVSASDATQRLPASAVTTGERTIVARPGGAAYCQVSPRFDSSQALQRLVQPSAKDRQRFGMAPERPGTLAMVLREPDLRLLAIALVSALLAALVIAFR